MKTNKYKPGELKNKTMNDNVKDQNREAEVIYNHENLQRLTSILLMIN
jgi:hypothetical protein